MASTLPFFFAFTNLYCNWMNSTNNGIHIGGKWWGGLPKGKGGWMRDRGSTSARKRGWGASEEGTGIQSVLKTNVTSRRGRPTTLSRLYIWWAQHTRYFVLCCQCDYFVIAIVIRLWPHCVYQYQSSWMCGVWVECASKCLYWIPLYIAWTQCMPYSLRHLFGVVSRTKSMCFIESPYGLWLQVYFT